MNRYSIASESDCWWVPTAIAGTIGAAAVSAIFVFPLIGAQASPVEAPGEGDVGQGGSGTVTIIDRPCYLARPGWNTPADWEQPVCSTEVRRGIEVRALGLARPLPDYLP